MRKVFLFFKFGFVGLVLSIMPQIVFGAELTFKVVPGAGVNDNTTLVEVRIDPESKKLNVVEGTIRFSGPATENLSVQIENGNSVLPLWPTPPQYIADEKAIHFIGGIPDGFDSEGLLFIMRISSSVAGDLGISYTDGSVYLNDGKGTKENIFSKSLQISLDQSSDNNLNRENLFLNQNEYGILVLVAMMLIFFVFYGYKKIKK